MLYEFLVILIKSLKNHCNISDLSEMITMFAKILNRFYDYNMLDTLNMENLDVSQKNEYIHFFFKHFTFQKIISSFFFLSSGLIILFYVNDIYYEQLIEYSQQIHEFLYPKIVKKEPQIVLLKASKDFFFYKESDISRILDYRFKRLENFLKEKGINLYKKEEQLLFEELD